MNEIIIHIDEEHKVTNGHALVKRLRDLRPGDYLVRIHTRKVRSLQQNAYYWSVVVDMVKDGFREVGYEDMDSDTVHDFLKARFLEKAIVNKQTGELLKMPQSTTELTTVTFNEYIDKCIKFAAEEMGITIPLPNEQIEIWNKEL